MLQVIEIADNFSKMSGLQLNKGKNLWSVDRCLKGQTDTEECVKWCMLGLKFSNQKTVSSCVMENWGTRINSAERVIAL